MINEIQLYKLNIPLIRPYKLAYGETNSFNTTVAVLKINNGYSCGAFTHLPGYFTLNPEDMWKKLVNYAASIVNKDENEILKVINGPKQDLLLSPIRIAIERLKFSLKNITGVPLIEIIERNNNSLKKSFSDKPRSYKIKVGMPGSFNQDIKFTQAVLKKIAPNSELRIDANQGYTLEKALEFIDKTKSKITYIEQPFSTERWRWNTELIKKTGVDVMLDESIMSKEDVSRAINCGVSYIKLKLAKFGSIFKTLEIMRFAEKKGLKVIIGNGVATGISNYIEAQIWHKGRTKMAGEMNGFLKINIKSDNLKLKNNKLYLTPDKKDFIYNSIPKNIIEKFIKYAE